MAIEYKQTPKSIKLESLDCETNQWMYKPAPILALLQPHVREGLIRIVHQYLELVLRPRDGGYMKRHARTLPGLLLILGRHSHRTHQRTRISSFALIRIASSGLLLLPVNQLKPIRIQTRARSRTLFFLSNPLELVHGSIDPLEDLVVEVDQPVVGVVRIVGRVVERVAAAEEVLGGGSDGFEEGFGLFGDLHDGELEFVEVVEEVEVLVGGDGSGGGGEAGDGGGEPAGGEGLEGFGLLGRAEVGEGRFLHRMVQRER